MILETIKNKLQEVDSNVFYGMVDKSMRETEWDYIVFNRKITKPGNEKTGYSHYFKVSIIFHNASERLIYVYYITERSDLQ